MATDPSPLKPQCDDALHEIYHLLSGEIDDAKREQDHRAPRRVRALRRAVRLLRRAPPVRAAALPGPGPARAPRPHRGRPPARAERVAPLGLRARPEIERAALAAAQPSAASYASVAACSLRLSGTTGSASSSCSLAVIPAIVIAVHRVPAEDAVAQVRARRLADARRPGRLGARGAGRGPGGGPGAVLRAPTSAHSLQRGLRRGHRGGRGAGRGRPPGCAACRARPGPGSPTAPAGCTPTSTASSASSARSPSGSATGWATPFAVERHAQGQRARGRHAARLDVGSGARSVRPARGRRPRGGAAEDQDLVYYVGPNVLALEKRFAFPPQEFRLWLALHEVTHRAQFTGVPWLREHYLGPRPADARLRRPRPEAVPRRAGQGRSTTCARVASPLDDGGLAALLATPSSGSSSTRSAG